MIKHEYYKRWRIDKVGEALDALSECLSATHWDVYKREYWSTFTKYQRMIEKVNNMVCHY